MACQSNRAGLGLTMSGTIRSSQVGFGYLNDYRLISLDFNRVPSEQYKTILDNTGPYEAMQNHMGPYGTIWYHRVPTGQYGTRKDHTGQYGTI